MLEIARMTGTPRREIAVETHRNTPIRNYVAPPPSQQDINLYYRAIRPQFPQWILRKDAVGVYNCAGMVWASRRTALTHPEDWEIILKEDGYRKFASESDAMVGDVVVYRSKKDKEILHVAKLCLIERPIYGETQGAVILKALSKWDQKCGEDIHRLADVNLSGNEPFDIELWTDRPAAPDPRIEHLKHLPFSI